MIRLTKYNNEKGFALILALSMLAIMSILGAFALMTSTTEVQISGNYSAGQQAFVAADRPLEMIDALIDDMGDFYSELDDEGIVALGTIAVFSERLDRSGLDLDSDNFVRAIFDRSNSPYLHIYYTTTLTGGFFQSETAPPRQRVRVETQKVRRSFIGSSTTSGDLQTTASGG